MFIFALAVIIAYAIYAMTPDERLKALRTALGYVNRTKEEVERRRAEPEPFRDALRERTPRPVATAVLAGISVLVFLMMLVGSGSFSDPATLVSWGANVAPRTTNGEWWRLVTMTFVHKGLMHLIIEVGALVSAGLVVERLLGPLAFAGVYVVAAVLAGLVGLSAHPLEVSVGSSGAIYGVYGLLSSSVVWGYIRRSPMTVPVRAAKTLGPPAALFLLYSFATDNLYGDAEFAGLAVGLMCGGVLARRLDETTAPAPMVGGLVAATLMTAVVMGVPLRGVSDARPEMVRVAAVEDRTSGVYDTAVNKFKNGWINAEALARVIDQTIMPDLLSARAHLQALGKVPTEQQQLVANAEEYFKLRDASWRLRAGALHRSDARGLRDADKVERASLEALEKIRPGGQ
ncbi:MAG TPA: rhomboid family intramembrane serine protease [Vicinamibacterales bacterium]